jgi:hypothetical protein
MATAQGFTIFDMKRNTYTTGFFSSNFDAVFFCELQGFQLVFQWISSISDGYLIKRDCSTTCPEGSPVLWP